MSDFQPEPFGKYTLVERIGVGPMAEYFRASIPDGEGSWTPIFLKRWLREVSGNKDLVAAFSNAARLASHFEHPNIARLFDFGIEKDTFYVAVEYLEGHSLQDLLAASSTKNRPVGVENAVHIISGICQGLAYAHGFEDPDGIVSNVIHGNLSPQSVLLTVDGEVKLTDFGVHTNNGQDKTARNDMMKSKLAYMSPEQVGGEPVDSRTDIFSVGLLFYEMVTGAPAFQGETMEIFSLVRQAHFQPPEKMSGGLPKSICAIINRCLSKDPAKRYPSAGTILEDLQVFKKESSVEDAAATAATCMQDLVHQDIANDQPQDHKETSEVQTTSPQAVSVTAPKSKQNASKQCTSKPEAPVQSVSHPRAEPRTTSPRNRITKSQKTVSEAPLGHHPPKRKRANKKSLPKPKRQSKKIPWLIVTPVALAVALVLALVLVGTPEKKQAAQGELFTVERAYRALEEKNFKQAVIGFEQALADDPIIRDDIARAYAEALDGHAANLLKNKPAKAETLLLTAKRFDPTNVEVWARLGMLYIHRKEYSKAIDTYEQAVRLDPQLAESFFNLGYLYAVTNNYLRAQEMYEQAVQLSPPFLDEALFNLAIVQDQVGKRQQSIKNLQRVIKINPKNKQAKQYLQKLAS